jgi:RNA-binding motif X-linked protein 2
VFAQYGELVDVHLVRDKTTGKSKGFAFLAYEDQRSTVLAVDNLSGAKVAGRKIRVEHVDNYKKRKAEVRRQQQQHLEWHSNKVAAYGHHADVADDLDCSDSTCRCTW